MIISEKYLLKLTEMSDSQKVLTAEIDEEKLGKFSNGESLDLSEIMSDLQKVLATEIDEEEFETSPMAEYTFKFTEINTGSVCIFSFDHRVDCPEDILMRSAAEELIADFAAADIEIDKSETKQNGRLLHENCWRVVFKLESDSFEFDGIPVDPDEEDMGSTFINHVMPIVIEQLCLGSFELLEVVEYEE